MVLPKPIYEALPAFYLIMAIFTATIFESSIALVSSVLFLITAALVFYMRRSYRSNYIEENAV